MCRRDWGAHRNRNMCVQEISPGAGHAVDWLLAGGGVAMKELCWN